MCYNPIMDTITFENSCYVVLAVLVLLICSRQILNLCLGLFVSIASIIMAIVSVVVCALMIFFIGLPTVTLTCYAVAKVSNGQGTESELVRDMCGIGSSKSTQHKEHHYTSSNKY